MDGQPVATIWGLLDLMASELQYQAIATRGHCPLSHVYSSEKLVPSCLILGASKEEAQGSFRFFKRRESCFVSHQQGAGRLRI